MKQTGHALMRGYVVKDGKVVKVPSYKLGFVQRLAAKKKERTPRLKRTR